MCIGGVPGTHLLHGVREQALTGKNVGVLSKEAEDQSGHEVVHFMALLTSAPVRIVFQQLNIQAVQATGGPYIKGAVTQLLNGRNAGQRQEETEVVRELLVFAGNRFTRLQILSLKISAVGRKDKPRLSPGSRGAFPELTQLMSDVSGIGHRNVDIVGL